MMSPDSLTEDDVEDFLEQTIQPALFKLGKGAPVGLYYYGAEAVVGGGEGQPLVVARCEIDITIGSILLHVSTTENAIHTLFPEMDEILVKMDSFASFSGFGYFYSQTVGSSVFLPSCRCMLYPFDKYDGTGYRKIIGKLLEDLQRAQPIFKLLSSRQLPLSKEIDFVMNTDKTGVS